MSDKLNIEQLIRSKLGEAEITPSPGAWKGIQQKLAWRQFLRFNPGKINIYYLAGLIIATTGLVVILSSNPDANVPHDAVNKSPAEIQQGIISEKEQAELPETTEVEKDNSGSSVIPPENQIKETVEDKSVTASELETLKQDTQEDGLIELKIPVVAPIETSALKTVIENHTLPAAVSYFTSSIKSGCAPLEVQFHNLSKHAVSYSWTFGVEGQSSSPDPVYLFEEPGSYKVTLKSENQEGQSSIHQETIEVHPGPNADFAIEEGFEGVDGHASLILLNYSGGANDYDWNLLTKDSAACSHWSSKDFQPPLKLTDIKNGAENIRLIATNEYGCIDTDIKALPIHVESSDVLIKFATAFSPNPTGPGDGTFSPHEKRIDLFHPIFLEVPVEYYLRVYTKRGELVFETREVYQGWDGYFHEERSAGGVYVWMLEGTWLNGETFKMQGDITLIWQDIW